MIEKTTFIENNVVMLTDYEKDKKYQKIDNQQTKKDIKVMLDQALTPEIRKFLPKLISKLNELQRFQSTLNAINNKFEETKKYQDTRMQDMTDNWTSIFSAHERSNQKETEEIHKKINKQV